MNPERIANKEILEIGKSEDSEQKIVHEMIFWQMYTKFLPIFTVLQFKLQLIYKKKKSQNQGVKEYNVLYPQLVRYSNCYSNRETISS